MDEERHEPNREIRHEGHQDPDVGRRGGSAAFAATGAPTAEAVGVWAETIVRWSPVWAGLLVAIGVDMAISTLGLAIALSTATATAAPSVVAADILQTATLWSAIGTLIALFVGGFLAGRLGVHAGLRSWLMQGTAVWALYLIVAMLFSLLGFAGLTSGLAGFAGLTDIQRVLTPGAQVTTAETAQAVSTAANAAWWLFIGIVVAWAAAIGGAAIGKGTVRTDEYHD